MFVLALLRLAWLRWQPRGRQLALSLGVAGLVLLLIVAVATGRLHWLFSVPAAIALFASRALPLLRGLRHLGGVGPGSAAGPSGGNRSRVETRLVRMVLDHDTGSLNGEVLEGPLAGRDLDDLGEADLFGLHRRGLEQDPDTARILETYLDRRFGPDWRARAGTRADDESGHEHRDADRGQMPRSEALAVLGLEDDPDRDTIIRAHRRLMQQFHPDRGGSDYLAAQLNRAKDRLLDDLAEH
ncbi:MAG: molecular chaperone DnaJ [Gammaproteobacteria bacterium]|nr:molecular chaperone DnaJ [Gammaproteobacteria bacterium]